MILVRRADPADAGSLARVHVRSWQAAYVGILDEALLAGLSVDVRTERWQHRLVDGQSMVWVVELDGEPVGFAGLGPSRDDDLDPDRWRELMSCYLLAEAWGTGAAHSLTDRAIEKNVDHFLWVLSDNHRAQAFYRKLGFVADGSRRPITIGERTVDETRMRRPAGVGSTGRTG